jgi:hypothetical protein
MEFDQLQRDLEIQISAGQRDAREKLLNNFDQEVVEKVRVQSHDHLDRFNERLWQLTRFLLAEYARFDEGEYIFQLEKNPFPGVTIHPGPYRMGKNSADANTYRIGHPLAKRLIEKGLAWADKPGEVVFDYTGSHKNIAILESIKGKSGWLLCTRFSVSALETEDYIIFSGLTDEGAACDETQCHRLFDLPGKAGVGQDAPDTIKTKLTEAAIRRRQEQLGEIAKRNNTWFDTEMDKLENWADDKRLGLKAELKEYDEAIAMLKKTARTAANLPEKLETQRKIRDLDTKRNLAWKAYDEAAKAVEKQKDELLDTVEERLKQTLEEKELFTIKWRLV